MKKTTKRKITTTAKRVVKPPSQSVVLSLMALILIAGAPALVSVIDDSYTYKDSLEIQLLDESESTSNGFIKTTDGEFLDKSYIPASENDGVFMIAVNDSTEVENISFARFSGVDMAPLISGIGTVKVITSCDLSKIIFRLSSSDEGIDSTSFSLTQSDTDPSMWTRSLSSVDLVKVRSGVYDAIFIDMFGQNELFDMQIFAVGEYVIPYGEIIIGATGAILIVCALFATPWFDIGRITAKPRRSK